MVCLWMLGVLLALSAHVTRGADDSGFERYECYRDLCVSRLQFCSDRERRCKYCQPGHCVDKEKTPKACLPLCPRECCTHIHPPVVKVSATGKMQRNPYEKVLVYFTPLSYSHRLITRNSTPSPQTSTRVPTVGIPTLPVA